MKEPQRVAITGLGARGEGLAQTAEGRLFIPFCLPGDEALVEAAGDRGRLIDIVAPSRDRVPPICPHFGACGGCAVQTLAPGAYAQWKRSLVLDALAREGLSPPVGPLIDAHGSGRRRAVFHARFGPPPERKAQVGFMASRSHQLVAIDHCPVLAPVLKDAPRVARLLAEALAPAGATLDIVALGAANGLDLDLRGTGSIEPVLLRKIIDLGLSLDLARLSLHGEALFVQRAPVLNMGRARVRPPPGAFVQATEAGEEILAQHVCEWLARAEQVADLFAGVGTFSLRLAQHAAVHARDSDSQALRSLSAAAREANLPARAERRDLFRNPLSTTELGRYDSVVLDPPRSGALAQCRQLASAEVVRIAYVSCAPATFARDAAILVAGGWRLGSVLAVDQFKYSPHVEIVGRFEKPRPKTARRLLG